MHSVMHSHVVASAEEWPLLSKLNPAQRALAVKFLIDEFVGAQVRLQWSKMEVQGSSLR